MSVHLKGLISFLDEQGLIDVLKKTTLHFEKQNSASSTVFDNLPVDYRERLMKAIVAFKIEVTAYDNVFKLSQNRDKKSYENIIEKLQHEGKDGSAIAKEMKHREDRLFPPGEKWDEKKFMS